MITEFRHGHTSGKEVKINIYKEHIQFTNERNLPIQLKKGKRPY